MPGNNSNFPLTLELNAPLEVANWRPLVHWLLGIPHLMVAYSLSSLFSVFTIIAFFSILFTRKIPKGIFSAMVMIIRHNWRIASYVTFAREDYPPFHYTLQTADTGDDQAALSITEPEEFNQWLPLVKWFLAIPHYVVLSILGIGLFFSLIVSFFTILFTGKYPEALRDYFINVYSYSVRVNMYTGLLTDEYPPFSL